MVFDMTDQHAREAMLDEAIARLAEPIIWPGDMPEADAVDAAAREYVEGPSIPEILKSEAA